MHKLNTIQEQILLLKIRHGDAGAYAEVYDVYVEPIFRYVSFRVPTQEIAQDITADTFLKVWERLTSVTETRVGNLRAYLYQVARNLIADHYRTRQPLLLDDVEEELGQETDDDDNFDKQATLAEIEQALKKLKPAWQEIVLLIYIEGLSIKEASEIINKSRGATRVLLHRALTEIKLLLK